MLCLPRKGSRRSRLHKISRRCREWSQGETNGQEGGGTVLSVRLTGVICAVVSNAEVDSNLDAGPADIIYRDVWNQKTPQTLFHSPPALYAPERVTLRHRVPRTGRRVSIRTGVAASYAERPLILPEIAHFGKRVSWRWQSYSTLS